MDILFIVVVFAALPLFWVWVSTEPRRVQTPRVLLHRLCSTAHLDMQEISVLDPETGKSIHPTWLELAIIRNNANLVLAIAYYFKQREASYNPASTRCEEAYHRILHLAIMVRLAVLGSVYERLFTSMRPNKAPKCQQIALENYIQIRERAIALIENTDPSLLYEVGSRL